MDEKILKFTVLGKPQAKQRARFNPDAEMRYNHKTKKFAKLAGYTPKKTVAYEKLVRQECWVAMRQQRFARLLDAVEVKLHIFCPIPERLNLTAIQGEIKSYPLPICHPDGDNVAKAILDALNGVLYRDDRQVSDLVIKKRYCTTPRVEVEVRGLI